MRNRLSTNLGSHVYGLGAIMLGLVGLAWGDFADVWQPVPPNVPHRTALAYIVAILLLSAGVAIQWRRTARYAIPVLIVLYFMAALLWVPRIVRFPRIYGTWAGFVEQFSLVPAGLIIYASLSSVSRNTLWSRVARFLYGLCVVSFGSAHLFYLSETAGMVPAWLPPTQRFWAIATAIAFFLAAIAILSGIQAVLASRLLTAMLFIFGALVWLPMLFSQPKVHMVWAGNAINFALMSAAWVISDSFANQNQ